MVDSVSHKFQYCLSLGVTLTKLGKTLEDFLKFGSPGRVHIPTSFDEIAKRYRYRIR